MITMIMMMYFAVIYRVSVWKGYQEKIFFWLNGKG